MPLCRPLPNAGFPAPGIRTTDCHSHIIHAGQARPYHWGMKTSYIFGAILACSIIGTFTGARTAKTVLLVLSGAFSLYGLVRLLA